VISLGMPAFACYRALYGYTTSINQTKPIMVIASAACCTTSSSTGCWSSATSACRKLGALGCAVATASGVWLMLARCWLDQASRRLPRHLSRSPTGKAALAARSAHAALGLPIGVTYFAEVSAFGAVSLLVARFGVVQVSAHQIALNFASLVFMVPLSFGIGADHPRRPVDGRRQSARRASWPGSAPACAGLRRAVGAVHRPVPLADRRHVHVGPGGAGHLRALLLFAALFQLSDATQVAASCAIRGYKVTRRRCRSSCSRSGASRCRSAAGWGWRRQWFPWSPAAPMAAAGFWIGLVLGLTVAAVLLAWALRRLARQRVAAARAG
jgi:MATE family multidrug resistance protein